MRYSKIFSLNIIAVTLTKSSKFQEDAVNIDKYNPYKEKLFGVPKLESLRIIIAITICNSLQYMF